MSARFLRRLPGILSFALLTACGGSGEPQEPLDPTYTYYKDIQPVMNRECSGCHFDGGIGPYPLESYAQVLPYAEAVARSVKDRSMPPWLPALESDCLPLLNERRLSAEEIEMFQVWAAEGAPEGDPADASAEPPVRPGLGEVSFDEGPLESYNPDTSISDDLRCFVIEGQLAQDEYIIGYDVRPGVPWLVHHVNVLISEADPAHKLDQEDPGPGWNCIDGIGINKVAMVGAWAPGTLPIMYPEDTGIMMEKDRVLVIQVHYNTLNGNVQPDNTHVLLQFADAPVSERAYVALLPNSGFEVPPNTDYYESTFSFNLPFEAKVWGGGGHMHNQGVTFRSSLATEDGETCFLFIDRWRYAWQQGYFWDTPLPIPASVGDEVSVTCAWTNPDDRTIIWGEKVTDEMCIGYFYVTGLDENTPMGKMTLNAADLL